MKKYVPHIIEIFIRDTLDVICSSAQKDLDDTTEDIFF